MIRQEAFNCLPCGTGGKISLPCSSVDCSCLSRLVVPIMVLSVYPTFSRPSFHEQGKLFLVCSFELLNLCDIGGRSLWLDRVLYSWYTAQLQSVLGQNCKGALALSRRSCCVNERFYIASSMITSDDTPVA